MNATISLIENESIIQDRKENNEREILKVPLGDLCFTTSGGTPSRKISSYYIGDIPWVKSGELGDNLIVKTDEYISEEAIKNSSAKLFPKGTLLIALYGANIGKLAFLGIDATTNQAICGIFENKYVNLKYIYYYLRFQRSKLIEQGIGGAQPNISQDIVRKQEIPVFSLAEQHRIVAKIEELFSSLDNGIQNLKTAQQQLKIYRQAVLKWAFEGKLTSTKNDISQSQGTNCLPEGWQWVNFGSCANNMDGKRIPLSKEVRAKRKGEYRYYGATQIVDYIDDYLFDGKYLLIGEDGANLLSKVKPLSFIVEGKFWVNNHAHIVQAKQGINLSFLCHYFNSLILSQYVTGTAQPKLTQANMNKILIPLPPTLEEQTQIVAEIESRLSICDKLEETIQTSLKQAEILRQSILKKAFSGQLVPQNPNDEPASLLLEKIQTERANNTPKTRSPKSRKKNNAIAL